jgi:hypothetical protein
MGLLAWPDLGPVRILDARGRSPGYPLRDCGRFARVRFDGQCALGRTGAAPTPKSNRLVQWPHTPNLRRPQRRRSGDGEPVLKFAQELLVQ